MYAEYTFQINLKCGYKREGIIAYECTSHSSHLLSHESHEITCSMYVTSLSWFDTAISFKNPKITQSKSFDMNWPQTYRSLGSYVGWMRAIIPSLCGL